MHEVFLPPFNQLSITPLLEMLPTMGCTQLKDTPAESSMLFECGFFFSGYILKWPHFFRCLWTDRNGSPRLKDEVEIRRAHIYRHENTVTVDLWKLSLRNMQGPYEFLSETSQMWEKYV